MLSVQSKILPIIIEGGQVEEVKFERWTSVLAEARYLGGSDHDYTRGNTYAVRAKRGFTKAIKVCKVKGYDHFEQPETEAVYRDAEHFYDNWELVGPLDDY